MNQKPKLIDLVIEAGITKSRECEPFKTLSKIYEQREVQRLIFTVDILKSSIFLILEVIVVKQEEEKNELIRLPFGCFTSLLLATQVAKRLNHILWEIH